MIISEFGRFPAYCASILCRHVYMCVPIVKANLLFPVYKFSTSKYKTNLVEFCDNPWLTVCIVG